MQKRFNSLRIISALIKFAAFLIGIISLAGFVFAIYVALARPPEFYPTNIPNAYGWLLFTGAAGLFGGLFIALLVYGAGAMIDLNLSIEEHTRASAIYARRTLNVLREGRADSSKPAPARSAPRGDPNALRSLPNPAARPVGPAPRQPAPAVSAFGNPLPPQRPEPATPPAGVPAAAARVASAPVAPVTIAAAAPITFSAPSAPVAPLPIVPEPITPDSIISDDEPSFG